jgi:glycosyltransferase involved in cell wall biosynthesis
MRVIFDNVSLASSSGPNSFGRKLLNEMRSRGHEAGIDVQNADAQLSFIQTVSRKADKVALRLDGIYFNTRQNWNAMNAPITDSFKSADLVVYQSNFNKRLTEKYFGIAKNHVVINNGTCLEDIRKISPVTHKELDKFEEVWCCASSWRPHKRLKDNIEYFLKSSSEKSCLVVLGENPDHFVRDSRVIYAGLQPWEVCISIYKRSKKFIHLAFLDHCPNVVVDARASGCEIVVASSGGTREVAGPNATVVQDIEWDLRPLDLYSPPPLDYNFTSKNNINSSIDICDISKKYIQALEAM